MESRGRAWPSAGCCEGKGAAAKLEALGSFLSPPPTRPGFSNLLPPGEEEIGREMKVEVRDWGAGPAAPQ